MTDAKQKKRVCMVSLILLVLLAAGILADIYAGYSRLSLQDFWEIILGGGDPGLRYTLIQLRLPRIFTSLLVGVGLGLAGGIIQGVAKNDMAEPGILGINAGAGLALAVFIVFFAGSSQNMTPLLPVIAFAGSVIVAIIDYRLAFTGNGLSPKRLLLIGIAVSTAVSSVTTMLMLRMSDSEYAFVQNWLAGSIWGASWSNVHILFVCLLVLGLLAFYKSRTLNVLVLGNQTATGLGVEVSKQSSWNRHWNVQSLLRCRRRLKLCGACVSSSGKASDRSELQIPDWDYSFTGCGASGVFRYYFQNPADSK